MAEERKHYRLMSSSPSVNLAKRLIKKYALKPPIDIERLINERAELVYKEIPFSGIDGISLNLKSRTEKTKVIVNSKQSPKRMRFTLAHELGHIIIPWHTGSIIDNPSLDSSEITVDDYGRIELEADEFAAELLMPSDFICVLLEQHADLAEIQVMISSVCDVSSLASAIQMTKFLPKNILYASENTGIVEYSGKSDGTLANALKWDECFPDNPYSYAKEYFYQNHDNRQLHWWRLPDSIPLNINDSREWREILNGIIDDSLCNDSDSISKIKHSINGITAYANSSAKQSGDYTIATIAAAIFQRCMDREELKFLVEHPDFQAFVFKRAQDFFSKSKQL